MKNRITDKISQFFGGTPYQHSEKEADSVKENLIKEEFERCIICGELTCVPVSMPVDWRENYEIGLGQVCAKCAKKQQNDKNTLSNAQILLAVEQSRKESKK